MDASACLDLHGTHAAQKTLRTGHCLIETTVRARNLWFPEVAETVRAVPMSAPASALAQEPACPGPKNGFRPRSRVPVTRLRLLVGFLANRYRGTQNRQPGR